MTRFGAAWPLVVPSAVATVSRSWQQHRAAATGMAFILALAVGLAAGFGSVIERVTAEGTASCVARSANGEFSMPSAPEPQTNGYAISETSRFRHVVDRPYEEPVGAATGTNGEVAEGTCNGMAINVRSDASQLADRHGNAAPNELNLFGR
jgi:hypothetical protein